VDPCGGDLLHVRRHHEGDEISGAAADGAYNAKDDTITGTMRFHQGDDLPFVWRRVTSVTKKGTKRQSTGINERKPRT
jgi:hypothetical protein